MNGSLAKRIDELRSDPCAAADVGRRMHEQMVRLYPICRSITGPGVRETLDVVGEGIGLTQHEVPSGSEAFDWTVNDEWTVREAYIAGPDGRRLLDFRHNNLHLVSYSTPVRATLSRQELEPHLHTLPDHPDWVPYRTSYYNRTWGFCVAQRELDTWGEGPFDVVVDTSLGPGALTYGELLIPGEGSEEVMFTAHVCHPSIANDNLTGIVIAAELARTVQEMGRHRYGYRFLFAPGTIGSIVWLSRNGEVLPRLHAGLVLTGLGGPGPLVYKRTRRGSRTVDDAVSHVVGRRRGEVRSYSPWGYDERQFNSPGFDLPFGRLSRTPHGEYPEYHTSADNLSFVTTAALVDAFMSILEVVDVLENDARFRNTSPYGEPQLGKRGIYPKTGGQSASNAVLAMLWVLAYSDGETSLLDIATLAGLDFAEVRQAATTLEGVALLETL